MTSLGQSGNAQHLIGSVAEMYAKGIISSIADKMMLQSLRRISRM